jgi:transcriptional regulator with GAF, ATPase, and Fis domain
VSETWADETGAFRNLLLDIALEQTLEGLLERIVARLATRPDAALVRIWLKYPGDVCQDCALREECPDRTHCLHLVASDGCSESNPKERWRGINGSFRRFPLGIRKVGMIGATGEELVIKEVRENDQWIARPEWVEKENVTGFIGQPIHYKGEVLGVLAVFLRTEVPDQTKFWIRAVADHLAAAIAHTRSLDEIRRLTEKLVRENQTLKEEIQDTQQYDDMVGQSDALRAIIRQIEVVAPTDASVLILGESGTGKELVARAIHSRGSRKDQPLVRVNCASIPKELYESEFFGHVRGAFTGAVKDRDGRFAAANGGTMFLDEVGEIPLELQSKLLRVLQEGTYERVGEEKTRKVNVRIIAATNRDLEKEAAAGRFRQDLFYRLNVFPMTVPPLRKRPADIAPLAQHFLTQAGRKFNRSGLRVSSTALAQLNNYDWPGNVRELQNIVEHAVITSRSSLVRFDSILASDQKSEEPPTQNELDSSDVHTNSAMRNMEKENLLRALMQTNWKVYGEGGAAELLEMRPTTLMSRIKKFKLKRPR